MTIFDKSVNRRRLLQGGVAVTAGLAAPTFFIKGAWADEFRNNPGNAKSVKFGFNVPQTGAYADEGADELRAYQLAVKHINGEGDGGLLNTMSNRGKTPGGLMRQIDSV